MRRVEDVRRQAVYWLGAIWFVAAYAVVSNSMTKFHHYILPAIPGLAIVIGCFLDELWTRGTPGAGRLVALIGIPLLALVVQDLVNAKNASQLFLWLFSYDYVHSPRGPPLARSAGFFHARSSCSGCCSPLVTAGLAFRRLVRPAIVGLCGVAVLFTWFLLDVYMVKVAPYWSQKDGIAAFYKHRRSPEEKLLAYQMYWRGETFYTKNEIYEGPMEDRTVFDMETADEKLGTWISSHRGRRVYFIFERGRQGRLQGLLPAETRGSFTVIYDDQQQVLGRLRRHLSRHLSRLSVNQLRGIDYGRHLPAGIKQLGLRRARAARAATTMPSPTWRPTSSAKTTRAPT